MYKYSVSILGTGLLTLEHTSRIGFLTEKETNEYIDLLKYNHIIIKKECSIPVQSFDYYIKELGNEIKNISLKIKKKSKQIL